ncbi:uncharacterized protein LOC135701311 [Ochlerotatus camptorhynchus]|uniref:uncharacterized protein LOC135701311 n=1 Tax=Ochlerotatus camptorhynchus TaxID=644619 RepID=UPI0031D6DAD3
MTNEKAFFRELNENVKIDVVLTDGSVTRSAEIGEDIVKCVDNDGRVRDFTFQEVLYMPNLDSSLLSVRKLTQKGLKVEFGASRFTVVNMEGEVVAVAVLSGNLYELSVVQDARLSKEARHSESCQHTWHRLERGINDAKVQEEQDEQQQIQEENSEFEEEFYGFETEEEDPVGRAVQDQNH